MKNTKSIFIVDDDEDDRLFMREAILDVIKDVNVIEISGGDEMYEQMEQAGTAEDLRLILIDMNMPRLNGLEILTSIKQDERWRHIPIVMVSTTSTPNLVNKAYELGVNAFITKPVFPKEYEMLAQTISLCFLSNIPSSGLAIANKRSKIKHVIVIEDNDDHWQLMDLSLKNTVSGIQTIRLHDRDSSLDFFRDHFKDLRPAPDFILLDLYLPTREDGLELLKEIRKYFTIKNLIHIPVIVVSYSNYQEDVNASFDGKANAYMVKPSDGRGWPAYFESLSYIFSHTIKLPQN